MNENNKNIHQLLKQFFGKNSRWGGIVGLLIAMALVYFNFSSTNLESFNNNPSLSDLQSSIENILKLEAAPPNITKESALAVTEENTVTNVIDGDTVDVFLNGKETRIRLIGINTPETVDPRVEVECLGEEASDKTEELLLNKKVVLEFDPAKGELDKYGRLLRYIFLEDGTNVNKVLVEQGYAYENAYGSPYKYESEFKQAQALAQQNKAGLWADNACLGFEPDEL